MSEAVDAAGRFDRTAEVYDDTRQPLTEEALDKAALLLSRDGCRQILEVGVGTGRIAKPLASRNFELVGVDFSRGMLAKARQKGVENLVMGDANHLPFDDKTFDAAVMAHVLHLLENPAETFGKLTRVARNEIIIFLRERDDSMPPAGSEEVLGLRETFNRVAEEMGYDLPPGAGDWHERFRNEAAFLSDFPPDEVVTIQDAQVVTTAGERLSFLEKGAYGYLSDVPDDVLRTVIERVKASVDAGKEIRYRQVEQMAVWRLPR